MSQAFFQRTEQHKSAKTPIFKFKSIHICNQVEASHVKQAIHHLLRIYHVRLQTGRIKETCCVRQFRLVCAPSLVAPDHPVPLPSSPRFMKPLGMQVEPYGITAKTMKIVFMSCSAGRAAE